MIVPAFRTGLQETAQFSDSDFITLVPLAEQSFDSPFEVAIGGAIVLQHK
jgi:hypothetical protein